MTVIENNLRKAGFALIMTLMVLLALSPASAEIANRASFAGEREQLVELPAVKAAIAQKGTVRVKLFKKKLTLSPGDVKGLSWKVWYRGSYNSIYTSSSNTQVARSYFSGSGLYVKAISPGKATVTLKSGSRRAKCKVTVKAPPATDIQLDQETASVEVGGIVTLHASVLPASANQKITWTTDDKKTATVKGGVVYAKKPGIAVITAKEVGGLKASCIIAVTPADSALQ